jgi:hypothetical protein
MYLEVSVYLNISDGEVEIFEIVRNKYVSRDSAVGIPTGYGLDD